jgi:hypothetical protein
VILHAWAATEFAEDQDLNTRGASDRGGCSVEGGSVGLGSALLALLRGEEVSVS